MRLLGWHSRRTSNRCLLAESDTSEAPCQTAASTESGQSRVLSREATAGALEQFRCFFTDLDSKRSGKISVVALTSALHHDEAMQALLRDSGVGDLFYLARQLSDADAGRVNWDQFLLYFDRARTQEVAGSHALHQLETIFGRIPVGRKGRVCTKRLAKRLRCDDSEEAMILAERLEQAGFCPFLAVLENLDRKPSRVTWQEFVEEYVCCLRITPQEGWHNKRSEMIQPQRSSLSLPPSESISDGEAVDVREWVEPRCWEKCFVGTPCGSAGVPKHLLTI